ncbi:myomegalin-like isoform X2 [Mytilus californianus]|uniref:myomegalin-like isoform X2 n=1 Tax=Mytilus californianus TaxID=6549 RepID=UPI0022461913|nr:myomegalin-like isoform X2 [Mytilus californianus]
MDSTCAYDPTLLVDLEGSTNANVLHEVTFGTHMEYPDGSVPMVAKNNSGRMSPVRGRTMKEYDQQLTELKKENFSLKLRIYFLEERMQQKFGDSDVFKTNIELKVELESVKNEYSDKQELLKKASNAMEAMSKQHELELNGIRDQIEKEHQKNVKQLLDEINQKQQELGQANKILEKTDREVKNLQEQIVQSQTQYAESGHKTQIQIQDLRDALAAKESLIGELQKDTAHYNENMQKLQQANYELSDKMENMEKEVNRKDRDIEQLTSVVHEKTFVDGESILVNNHLQDVVDDQTETLKKVKLENERYKQDLTQKNRMIGKLEDLMKTAAQDKKDLENKVKELESVLDEKQKSIQKRDKAVMGMRTLIVEKTKEAEDFTKKLEDKEGELRALQKEYQDMKLGKSKALEQKHEEVNYLEEKALSTQAYLQQQETELEKLMRTLGKKEGELESFKDLLTKAENALIQSEDAVDGLQKQLKKESGLDSHTRHYQTLFEDAQKQVEGKDQLVKNLTESLQDKDRQIQYCMEIFRPTKEEEKKSMDGWMKDLQDKLREKNKALEEATGEKYRILDEKDGEIRKLKQQIREKERDLEKANQTLISTEETIDGLEQECSDKELNMKQLVTSLKSAQRSFEDALDNHARVLREKDSIIKRLQNSLAEKERNLETSQWSGNSSNEELNRLKKQLKEKDDLLQDVMSEQSKATAANAEALNNLLKKLKSKDEDIRELMDRSNKEMSDLQNKLQQLQAELNRKQLSSKSSENQLIDIEQDHRQAIDKLAGALKDKDKTIETLVESGQEKDKLIQRLQQVHAASRGTMMDNNRLRDEADELRNQLAKKKDEIGELKLQLDRDGSRSPKAGFHVALEELKLQLAVKTEALKAAKQTEEDFREQINSLRKQLESAHQSMKEIHTTEKQVYYMRDNSDGNNDQYQDFIQRELNELHRIQEAEKQILLDLKEKSMFEKSHNLEAEVAAIQTLKRELEAGIQRNNKLQQQLEQQKSRSPSKGSKDSSQDEHFDMERRFSDQSTCSDTAGTSDSRRSSDTTPRNQDIEVPQHSYSWPLVQNKKPQLLKTWSPSSTDSDIPLNRQSLSEMSAPMLRKFIRQMKNQFDKAGKENDELRRKVDGFDSREIPGRNDSDVSSLPVMHLEIERLTQELSVKNEEIRKLKSSIGFAVDTMDLKDVPNLTDLQNENLKLKVQLGNLEELNMLLKKQIALNSQSANTEGFNPELIVQMANEIRNLKTQLDNVGARHDKSNVSCQTAPWSDAIITNGQIENKSQKRNSKIPQIQKPAPMRSNSSDRDSPDVLKSLLMEARGRMQALEGKLEATEGTVRLQTKKMKYYRNLLEENGLSFKSPLGSRSNSESNIVMALGGRNLCRNNRTLSYDNIPELLVDSQTESSESDFSEKYKSYGNTDNVSELKEQVRQLKTVMEKYKAVIKSQMSQRDASMGQRDTSMGGMSTQTHHDMDDTFIPRQSLRDLQCKLSASEENNLYLRQKISGLENSLSDLKLELKRYQNQDQLDGHNISQGSPSKQIIETHKTEILFLRKKLAETQNSCVQLEGWLNELSEFLSELMHVDEDGRHGNMRGIKQKVDKSRHMIQSMSSTLLEQDFTEGSFSVNEDSTFFNGNDSIRQNIQTLTEELSKKNLEVEKLTEEVIRKNSRISQLDQSLLVTQNKLLLVQGSQGSVTTNGHNSSRSSDHMGTSHTRNTVSPIRSPTSTTSDTRRFSDMSNFNQNEKSTERLRHATGTSDGSTAPFGHSVNDVNFTQETMDSSMRSAGTQDSTSRSFMKSHQNGVSDYTCTSMLGSEERMMDNRHDFYDASHTPSYLHNGNDVTFPSLHFENSHRENDNSRHVTFSDATGRESPVNNVSVLTTRLNALEDLNRTLKDEVNLYEKMCTSMGTQISPRKSPSKSAGDLDKDLLLEHLQEIRALRTKLEKSLEDSDRLREALERDMKKDNVETDFSSDVYLYSQHQSVVRELQFTIQKLEQELADKDDLINSVHLRAERENMVSHNRSSFAESSHFHDMTQTVEKLKQLLREREEKVTELNRSVTKHENDMQQMCHCNKEKETVIHKLEQRLSQAETAAEKKSKDHHMLVQTLEKSIFEKEKVIKEKLSVIRETEKIIEEKVVTIREKDEQSVENKKTLVLQQRKIEEFDKTMIQMKKKLDLQEQSLHQQEQKLKEQYDIIKQQDDQNRQYIEAIQQRDDQIKQYEIAISRREEKIKQLELTIRSVEDERQSLETSSRRREEICQQREDKLKIHEEQRKTEIEKAKKNELNLRKAAREIKRLNTEVKTLQEQVQENKDLNQTMKLELSVYEKLEKQEGDYDTMGGFDIRDLLTEIRHLRVQLERCIETNNALRQKLEEHLLHQHSPRSHPSNAKSQSPARSGTTTGTDATDGQPSPEKPRVQHENSQSSQLSSVASLSQSSSVSEDHFAAQSLDIHTWPGTSFDRKHDTVTSTHSLPIGPLHRSLTEIIHKERKPEGNLSYYVDDPPSKLADFTFQQTVDSDLRNLFAVGKLDDYEKLKKENYESLIVLNGVEARIQERLKMFKTAPVSESIEYSTLKELSLSVENMKICLNEEKSLITCFWTTTLPKGDTSGQKLMTENDALRNELYATRTKYELMSKLVHDAEERLHASNRQKQTMEDIIYKQLKRTTKVMAKARTNFEKVSEFQQEKENLLKNVNIDVDDIESSIDNFSSR